jgi:hypothetical protein
MGPAFFAVPIEQECTPRVIAREGRVGNDIGSGPQSISGFELQHAQSSTFVRSGS